MGVSSDAVISSETRATTPPQTFAMTGGEVGKREKSSTYKAGLKGFVALGLQWLLRSSDCRPPARWPGGWR